jgi:ethanolamine utilization protein EutL
MIGDHIPVQILSVQMIANVSTELAKALKLSAEDRAIGLISTDCDDATYLALDEATKAAEVSVVYARSLYAGASNASTKLAGEVIGILAGATPSAVTSGLQGAVRFLQSGVGFQTANDAGDIVYLAHCVSSTGSYLSAQAGVRQGEALAYLVAPPVETFVALDAALKAADVTLVSFFAPPTETNFAGGLLTGTQSACMAACDAFAEAVRGVAANPQQDGDGGRVYGIG